MARHLTIDVDALADAISETMEEAHNSAAESSYWAVKRYMAVAAEHIAAVVSHADGATSVDIKAFMEQCHLGR